MTSLTDLTLPFSSLSFDGDDQATAIADAWSATQIAGLLQAVIERHARQAADLQPIHLVSITFDVSSDDELNDRLHFKSRIDRKTRTLVFASGLARHGDRHVLKATIVYRID